MKTNLLAVLSLVLAVSSSAFADKPKDQPVPSKGLPKLELTWDNFKKFCANPNDFGRQEAPREIVISCSESKTTWKPVPGSFNMPVAHTFYASVNSSKAVVSTAALPVPAEAELGACGKYQQYTQTFKTGDRSITCDELNSMKDNSLESICSAQIGKDKGKGNGEINEIPTAGVPAYDTCVGIK